MTQTEKIQINDTVFQLLGIPLAGILIPHISGILRNEEYGLPELVSNYSYFLLVSVIIWKGNRYLYYFLRKSLWGPLTNILFTAITALGLLFLWQYYSNENYIDPGRLVTAMLLWILCVAFIIEGYEILYLNKAKSIAELEALKSQIDPHFFFNSLSTLIHLIDLSPSRAKMYNKALAESYRYILMNREKIFVLLNEEIGFVLNYYALLQIKFDNAIRILIHIEEKEMDNYLALPVSLQPLIENVVKHNEVSALYPLQISIFLDGQSVIVENKIRRKIPGQPRTRTGLKNLDRRCNIATGRGIQVNEDNHIFSVSIPIMKI